MKSWVRWKALRFSLGLGAVGLLFLSLFQNCQNAAQLGVTPSSSSIASSSHPSEALSYQPVALDQVCSDPLPDKKAVINAYVRYLHRCPDRAGLDEWYHSLQRLGNLNRLAPVLQSTTEYKTQKLIGQTSSDRYCLPGDTFRVMANGRELTSAEMDTIAPADARIFSAICTTSSAQNVTTALSRLGRDTLSTYADSSGGFICYVPGDSLKNQIIELYLAYLDRCPEGTGLNWWKQNWVSEASFISNPDVQGYLNCRYPGGSITSGPQDTIDVCYIQKFNIQLCPASTYFVKGRHCRK